MNKLRLHTLRPTSDLQGHLKVISTVARQSNSNQRKEIVRELIDLVSEILAYSDQRLASKNDPNLSLNPDEADRLRRKALMWRSWLEGRQIAEIAESHGVTDNTVRLHLRDIVGLIRKRTRTAAIFMGDDDPLDGIPGRPVMLTPKDGTGVRLTAEERTAFLEALTSFEKELRRREEGLPWADIWQ